MLSNPAKNNTITTSSKEVINANKPDITLVKLMVIIFIKVFTGLFPRLAAALVTL